jgi:hypothetical protein
MDGSWLRVTATGTVMTGLGVLAKKSKYWRNDVPMLSVIQYRVTRVSTESLSQWRSRLPSTSDQSRSLSTIQAARPIGESIRDAAMVSGRVSMISEYPPSALSYSSSASR